MKTPNLLVRGFFMPLGDLITGQSVHSKLKFLEKTQHWQRENLIAYQSERLQALVKHAYKNVPYYYDLFNSNRLKPEEIKTEDDLQKIPLLTKKIIKSEGTNRFLAKNINKNQLVKLSSSGSTGEPLFYFSTKDAYSMNIAANLRGWEWMGFKIGDRYIKLSQNKRNRFSKKMQDRLSNNMYIKINPLTDEQFNYILTHIETYKPKVIRCYPDPFLFLARYKQKHPEFKHQPLALQTTGNTLYPETRKEIENSFGCKIFDSYSCEGNPVFFECNTHQGYHIADEYGITEFLDDHNSTVNQGIARIVSTDLWNFAHPFIRYETQDLVELSSSSCRCEKQLSNVKKIIGRENDVLTTPSGKKLIVHNFTGFFQQDNPIINKSVEHFQFIESKTNYILNLVVNKNFTTEAKEYIKQYWGDEIGANVEIKIVNQIKLTASGKRKFIIKE
ncbi:MAG: phenylacetate--CoA ligase family protein [Clostridia bacterium]|nr:phenylacetate--CoA ligase family protein [Clostridia bacterium]HPE57653.1 phenylacetate--CoA ligase family protein [Bacteroidales bacterium]